MGSRTRQKTPSTLDAKMGTHVAGMAKSRRKWPGTIRVLGYCDESACGRGGSATKQTRLKLALSGLTREPQLNASCHVHQLSTYLHWGKCTPPP